MLEHAKPDLIQQPSSCLLEHHCSILLFHQFPWQHVLSCMNMAVDLSWWFQERWFHEQSVPACMNKPVNKHRVQACQQPCSSWPAQPCPSLSTTLSKPVNNTVQACPQHCPSLSTTIFKLASSTMFKPVNNTVQACQQHYPKPCPQHCPSLSTTIFKLAQPCSSLSTRKNKLCIFTCVNGVSIGSWGDKYGPYPHNNHPWWWTSKPFKPEYN